MASSKPAVVLVHGAWHSPFHYDNLTEDLKAAGFEVAFPQLPSSGGFDADFQPDVAVIQSAIKSFTNAGKDVALVMHSYGGIPGGEAVNGLVKGAKGNVHGVTKMIYMTAWAPQQGLSLHDHLPGGDRMEWWNKVVTDPKTGNQAYEIVDAIEPLYTDVDPAVANSLPPTLKVQSVGSFATKVTYSPWRDVDCLYILCEKDKAIPAFLQEKFINDAEGQGKGFETVRINTGHSPWASARIENSKIITDYLLRH